MNILNQPTLANHHWLCPACQQSLTFQQSNWRCAQGHSFDRAKEGYVNLLLAQHKNSKAPGDNNDMVLARRAFLQQDHYLPLATRLAKLLQQHLTESGPQGQALGLFDAGCGEGYYLGKIVPMLAASGVSISASGIDISKPAIQKAARQYKQHHFAVASTYQLPLATGSQAAVLQIFAPASSAEIHRVLSDNGVWLSVNPAPGHLFELKAMVYDTPQSHSINHSDEAGFSLVEQVRLSFEINLQAPEQRRNLLLMTPFYWSISEQKKQLLMAGLLTVSADFDIKVWRKNAPY